MDMDKNVFFYEVIDYFSTGKRSLFKPDLIILNIGLLKIALQRVHWLQGTLGQGSQNGKRGGKREEKQRKGTHRHYEEKKREGSEKGDQNVWITQGRAFGGKNSLAPGLEISGLRVEWTEGFWEHLQEVSTLIYKLQNSILCSEVQFEFVYVMDYIDGF